VLPLDDEQLLQAAGPFRATPIPTARRSARLAGKPAMANGTVAGALHELSVAVAQLGDGAA
jgi:hypothetical protein